jgi:hypothetical protein
MLCLFIKQGIFISKITQFKSGIAYGYKKKIENKKNPRPEVAVQAGLNSFSCFNK